MKNLRVFLVIMVAISNCAVFASYPPPTGLWQFNDANNLTKATIGSNLIEIGTHSAVAGIDAADGAVYDPLTSYYKCNHNATANGGGVYVNEWTLLMDVKVPAASIGHWVCFFQTNLNNLNDGDCFVHATNKTIGVGDTGYSTKTITADTWYRVVVVVDNGSFYRIWLNGVLWLYGSIQSLDGRFGLEPQIMFFADENGDDYPIICTNIAFWPKTLTNAQIIELGTTSTVIAADPNMQAGVNQICNPTGEQCEFGWTIIDGNDWQATDRTDWHWPRTNNYYFTPGRAAHGEICQTISTGLFTNDIDNGIIAANVSGYIGGNNDGDSGRIIVEYLDNSNTILTTTDSGWIEGANSVNWTLFAPYTTDFILPSGTRYVKYRLLAERVNGTDCDSFFDDLCFEFKKITSGNTAPGTPSITGSASVSTGINSSYTFASTDGQTNNVSYQIDWGNETSVWSDFQASGTNYTASHSWSVLGTYTIRARARDINGAVGEWSTYTVTVSGDAAGVFKSEPFLQNVSKTAITISWETDRAVNPTVDWGPTSSYGNNTKGICIQPALTNSGTMMYLCKVRISGLAADTTYHFRANNGSTASTDRTFTTAPNEDKPFTFGVWSDSQQVVKRLNGGTEYPACSTAIFTDMAANVDMAVSTGDVVDTSSYYLYSTAFRPYASNILGKQKPFFVAFGNHDESMTSLIHKTVQNSGMNSFSFNYGNAHFTCVVHSDNVKGALPSDDHINSLPLDWIEQDLASEDAQNATWRFLFVHVPPYCERWFDGSSLMQTYLVPLLNQYNVQMCLSGHTHEYERGMLNGTFYVITGVCSYLDIIEPITEDWSFMTIGGAQNIPGLPEGGGLMHGWTEIKIDGTELQLKQHGYNLNGTYFGVIDNITFALSDFNADKKIDMTDLSQLADNWLAEGQYLKYDLVDRSSQIINMRDFAEFTDYWFFEEQF
jgi:predicted phosphodiesterase